MLRYNNQEDTVEFIINLQSGRKSRRETNDKLASAEVSTGAQTRTLDQLGGVIEAHQRRRTSMLGYETQVKIIPEKGEGGEW